MQSNGTCSQINWPERCRGLIISGSMCFILKSTSLGNILVFQLSSTFIRSTVIGVYNGEIGGDGGIPSGVLQTTKSHHNLQVT